MSERRVVPYTFPTVSVTVGTSPSSEPDPTTLSDGVDVRDWREASVMVVCSALDPGATLQIWAVVDESASSPWIHLSREDEEINNTGPDLYGPYNVREFKRFAAILKSVSGSGTCTRTLSIS